MGLADDLDGHLAHRLEERRADLRRDAVVEVGHRLDAEIVAS